MLLHIYITNSFHSIAILTLVTTQCVENGVQFFKDGQIVNNSRSLSISAGESFIISCKRCDTTKKKPPKWFYNGTAISPCNDMSNVSVCTAPSASDKIARELHFTSFTALLSGTYQCTSIDMNTINITELS